MKDRFSSWFEKLGRQLQRWIDRHIPGRDEREDEPEPEQPKPPSSGNPGGSQTFLWKPVSESTGNLVVLVLNRHFGMTDTLTIKSESRRMRGEDDNGNRLHFYFGRPGSYYGNNIEVTLKQTDGKVFKWIVPNGSLRFETR